MKALWRKWQRVVLVSTVTTTALVAFIGYLHTPAGRPLLARIGVGCPVKASGEDVERARLTAARAARGTSASPARPALGFTLDTMTLSDVKAWAERNNVSCEESRSGSLLRCADVPSASVRRAGPKFDELAFGFVPSTKRLVNITTLQRDLESSVAVTEMYEVAATLEKELGPPSIASGSRSTAYLDGAAMRTAMLEYRFTDYFADVSTTNMGHGLMVREHYMSAKDD